MKHSKKLTIFIILIIIISCIFYIYKKHGKGFYELYSLKKQLDIKPLKINQLHDIQVIAHAGGEIDSLIYTNSLEAINSSYGKGVKLIELDILETSDNHFVAAHDWEKWKKSTNFQGSIPPTLKEFKKYKIYGRYTPLDMQSINHWFSNHIDAVLITDKINQPKKFSNLFIDSSRLKMELFDQKAIKEMSDLNIPNSIWANYHIFNKMNDNELISYFLKNNITNVVVGAPADKKTKKRLNLLRNIGVKINMYLFGNPLEINQQVELYKDYIDRVYFNRIDCIQNE